ncbi:VOC family protein [Pseudoalteromonas sp. J010]|uniref:VOC family protein n=1 Tax=unclassified Pseudoalteromonas TaxID=194690 RepID=UPI000F64D5BA|nr:MULTISPECIES: VOC family protein [unclassified Pseudoalteromonas]RRS08433.1 VOC family protein [Pseudoalteromonas sp. J010]USD30424.1 VOC family protein [Pseudoalteromonas sp. SCSIO 43201]
MYLEHVNLVVSDLKATLAFYQAAFPHWKVRSQGQGEWHGKSRSWLHFGDDYHYIAFSDHGEGQNRVLTGHQVGFAHFAYVVQNIASVVKRLTEAGYDVDKVGAQHPYRKNVYFIDPAGFEIEFVEYLSDLPTQRNSD